MTENATPGRSLQGGPGRVMVTMVRTCVRRVLWYGDLGRLSWPTCTDCPATWKGPAQNSHSLVQGSFKHQKARPAIEGLLAIGLPRGWPMNWSVPTLGDSLPLGDSLCLTLDRQLFIRSGARTKGNKRRQLCTSPDSFPVPTILDQNPLASPRGTCSSCWQRYQHERGRSRPR